MMNTVQTAPPQGKPSYWVGNRIHSSDGKARRNCEGKEKKEKKGGINFFSYLIIIIMIMIIM